MKRKIYWKLHRFLFQKGTVVRSEEGLKDAVGRYGYPLVIKPIDGNHGKGNTTNITTWDQATKALEAAQKYGRSVIVEKFITGVDFRVLVINYKFICAALRTPASVIGDGEHNIQWLIDETNKDPRRGYGHEKVLTQITIDQFTQKMLDEKRYTLETVPAKKELVLLKPTANLSQEALRLMLLMKCIPSIFLWPSALHASSVLTFAALILWRPISSAHNRKWRSCTGSECRPGLSHAR
jgi:D-alanine-D-alanine ligase-like ATP-grasp enzyme